MHVATSDLCTSCSMHIIVSASPALVCLESMMKEKSTLSPPRLSAYLMNPGSRIDSVAAHPSLTIITCIRGQGMAADATAFLSRDSSGGRRKTGRMQGTTQTAIKNHALHITSRMQFICPERLLPVFQCITHNNIVSRVAVV